jgi:hypothetical protein
MESHTRQNARRSRTYHSQTVLSSDHDANKLFTNHGSKISPREHQTRIGWLGDDLFLKKTKKITISVGGPRKIYQRMEIRLPLLFLARGIPCSSGLRKSRTISHSCGTCRNHPIVHPLGVMAVGVCILLRGELGVHARCILNSHFQMLQGLPGCGIAWKE